MPIDMVVLGQIFAAVFVVSILSLLGAFTLGMSNKKIEKWLEAMVAFAIGGLLGDVFIHLLPELSRQGFTPTISLTILAGIITFFILEKVIHWHHCHHASHGPQCPRFTYMSLAADSIHNGIDGMIIAGSFLAGPIVGISTAAAVFLHEVPQEIGHFGILLKGGFSKKKALSFNFLTALVAFAGAILAIIFSSFIQGATPLFLAFAAGNFLYIAGTDLFPELNKHFSTKKAIIQLVFILLGVAIMSIMLLLE